MTTMLQSAEQAALDPRWAGVARYWGLFAGVAFMVATLAYMAEELHLLATPPVYAATAAGQLKDEAVYWAATFAYRNATVWDYVLRDGLFLFAYVGFLPLLLAANVATGGRRAAVQVGGVFIAANAIFGALNAITYFVEVSYWRNTGWDQVPAEIMVAVGRSSQFFDDLSFWCGIAGSAVGIVGLLYLGYACRTEPALPRRLGLVAWFGAVVQVVVVTLAVFAVDNVDALSNMLSLVMGLAVVPAIAIGLGLHLGRTLGGRAAAS